LNTHTPILMLMRFTYRWKSDQNVINRISVELLNTPSTLRHWTFAKQMRPNYEKWGRTIGEAGVKAE
jgi:hypothetical protein